MFITFEGGEATGKTTQIHLLKKYLEEKGKSVVLTREPGGDENCERIRSLLLEHTWEPITEAFLFNASRYEHCKKVIEPALNEGKIVLCDRFMDSTMVYQGYGLGLSLEFLKTLQHYAVTRVPDLTFIFDLDPLIARARLALRSHNNHIDDRDLNFHEKVRAGFLTIAKNAPKRCVVVDASMEEKKIQETLKTYFF